SRLADLTPPGGTRPLSSVQRVPTRCQLDRECRNLRRMVPLPGGRQRGGNVRVWKTRAVALVSCAAQLWRPLSVTRSAACHTICPLLTGIDKSKLTFDRDPFPGGSDLPVFSVRSECSYRCSYDVHQAADTYGSLGPY
ncbi:unnamed protein product, partial [Nesidiocoris tenuis]